MPTKGYIKEFKVDISLFHTFRVIELGRGLIIRPLKIQQLDLETEVYFMNSHDAEVKKYLPDLYPATKDNAGQILSDLLYATMLHRRFIYAVCLEDKNFPIGYVVCSSPLTTFRGMTEKVGDWVIDFWVTPQLRNKGVMTVALPPLFEYLSEFRIPSLIAFTDKNNIGSIKLLKNVGFRQTNELNDKSFYSFRRNI